MALPDRLQPAVDRHLKSLDQLRVMTQQSITQMAAGNVDIITFHGILQRYVSARNDIVDIKARPGVAQYVRNQFGRASLDLVGRVNAVQSALEAVITRIRDAAPTGAQGFVLAHQWSAGAFDENQILWRIFTPAQTVSIRTDLQAVVAAINTLFDDLEALI